LRIKKNDQNFLKTSIKLYNGGHYVTNIDGNGNATFKNFEEYKGINISYVEKISNIRE